MLVNCSLLRLAQSFGTTIIIIEKTHKCIGKKLKKPPADLLDVLTDFFFLRIYTQTTP